LRASSAGAKLSNFHKLADLREQSGELSEQQLQVIMQDCGARSVKLELERAASSPNLPAAVLSTNDSSSASLKVPNSRYEMKSNCGAMNFKLMENSI
jgi:hypothetical protein